MKYILIKSGPLVCVALIGISLLFSFPLVSGLNSASAAARYGIQGQPAPELNLTEWIGGNGKPIDPIQLADFRGSVIYLYFFQDW